MTLKMPRISDLMVITDKPASRPYSRFWDAAMTRLEQAFNGNQSLTELQAGVAYRDQDNEFSGQNTFDQIPVSEQGYAVNNVQVVGPQDTGWTAATGTANKGAYAAYAGQTIGAPPTQAQVQALDNAVVALSQRVVAIETALRTHGLIDG